MKHIIILLILCCALFAKEYIDVVYLKNGSIIKGVIIEQIPSQTIKIKTAGGSVFVYQMDEVVKIVKEEKLTPKSNFSNSNPFKGQKLTSINPLGLVIGGISSLNFEKHISKNQVSSKKIDLWTVVSTDYYGYETTETGIGGGMGTRYYIPSSKPFSGLFAGASFDCVFVEVYDEWYDDNYNSFALASSTTLGLSLPLGTLRLEPMLNLAYVFISNDYGTSSGILLIPELRIGLISF